MVLDRHDDGRRSPDWLHRRAAPKAAKPGTEAADSGRTPGVPRSGIASSLGVSRRATSVIVRPVARLGPDGHVGVLAHTNVELLNTVIKDKTGAEWSPGAHDKLRVQPLLAHYHSDGSPEQELSADNPEAISRVIGLAELTASEAGLTLSDRRKADGSLQTLADTLQGDPAAFPSLTQGEQAPVKIDWCDDAVIVTLAVVRPKSQDNDYVTHTGQLMADLRLAGSRAETQYVEHAYLSDPGEQWSQMERYVQPGWNGAFAGGHQFGISNLPPAALLEPLNGSTTCSRLASTAFHYFESA